MYQKFSEITPPTAYHFITQSIIPRPIAWVLTENEDGSFNLAPFSYFTPVSSSPALLMISAGKKPNGEFKDTFENIKQRPKFVVHIASTNQMQSLNQTAALLPFGQSEVSEQNITLEQFEGFSLPKVQGCPVAFGCELFSTQSIGNTPQQLIFGEITDFFGDDTVCENIDNRVKIDASKINPLSRLGAGQYGGLGEVFDLPMPK